MATQAAASRERKRGYLSGIGDEQSVGSDKQRAGPENLVAYWDFDDPAIPNAEVDTAATAIVVQAAFSKAKSRLRCR
jgi:hypothetical protein